MVSLQKAGWPAAGGHFSHTGRKRRTSSSEAHSSSEREGTLSEWFNLLCNVLTSELCESIALWWLMVPENTINNCFGFCFSLIIWQYHCCFYSSSNIKKHFSLAITRSLNLWPQPIAEGAPGTLGGRTAEETPRQYSSQRNCFQAWARMWVHSPNYACSAILKSKSRPSHKQKLRWNTGSSVFLCDVG